jgi:hypothetical protein
MMSEYTRRFLGSKPEGNMVDRNNPRDLHAAQHAANDNAGRLGALWLGLITLAAYLFLCDCAARP